MLSQPETLRHLIALTLNRGSELPSEVQDFENLLQFLAVYPCSEQTKWLCSQLWRQPEVYFERYQQLLALCTPVVQAHEAALQAEFDAAAAQMRAAAVSLWGFSFTVTLPRSRSRLQWSTPSMVVTLSVNTGVTAVV